MAVSLALQPLLLDQTCGDRAGEKATLYPLELNTHQGMEGWLVI